MQEGGIWNSKERFPNKSENFDLKEVERELAERDKRDEERAHSPLLIPENAHCY